MLPRLRFVVAAAIIAALPWCVFNSGLVTDLPNSSIAEYSRQYVPASFAVADLYDARQMYLMSYVRRSRELERLRTLATGPLSEWILTPSGETEPLPLVARSNQDPGEILTEVAALPAATVVAAPVIVEPEVPDPAPPPTSGENAQQTSTDILKENEPAVRGHAALDRDQPIREQPIEAGFVQPIETGFVPPLPLARPHPLRTTVKRRHYRPQHVATVPPPVPPIFAGPPAPPTTSNNFAQRYGYPL